MQNLNVDINTIYKISKLPISINGKVRGLARITWVLLLAVMLQNSFAQDSSLDNYTGTWTDNASWTSGSYPGPTNIAEDIDIYGNIQHVGDIEFNSGTLTVYDTLVIIGNLTLLNNADLTLESGAIVIVRGDFEAKNKVDAATDGYFIVTGEFTMLGSNEQGSFTSTGTVIIFDSPPDVPEGGNYADLECADDTDYPDNCGYGDSLYLSTDPIFDFFNSGGFTIIASGPTEFCPGESVDLSVNDDGDSYQWYMDSSPITGATSYIYTASISGSYYVEVSVGSIVTETDEITVTASDTEYPTIIAPANVSVSTDTDACFASGVDLGTPTTNDNCGIASTVNDAPASFPLGITTVTWTVTDNSGLSTTDSHTVSVSDNVKPSITPPADVTVDTDAGQCTATGVDLGTPVTSDNCTVSTVVNDATEPFALGNTTVTWTVTDAAGNSETATQIVTVEDNIKPAITAPADVTVDTDAGQCTASGVTLGNPITADNCSIASIVNDAAEPFALGNTIITWTITDAAGNSETATQIVTVEDNIKPAITAPADVTVDTDTGQCTATGVDLGTPVTSDNCTVSTVVNDATEPFALGNTTITWTVSDAAGNSETATQIVTVEDNISPTITAPADVIVSSDPGVCTASGVALGSPTTADNCGIASVDNDAPTIFQDGPTTVTWTVTDNAGQSATATQIVTVLESEDPVLSNCPTDFSIPADDQYCGSVATWTAPTASDNCSVTLTSNYEPGDYFLIGTTTVIYTATDGSGNSVDCSFDITVDAPSPVTIDGESSVCTPSTETYSLPGLSGKTYSWNVNEGDIVGSNTEQSVDINWTSTTLGTVSVIVTSDSGCNVNGSLMVNKIPGPETSEIRSEFNPLGGPGYLSEVCPGDTGLYYAVTGSAGSTFEWNVNGGSITRNFGDSVIVNWTQLPGEYEISVQETSTNTCTGEAKTGSVLVILLSVELGNDTTICNGEVLQLTPVGEYDAIIWHDSSTVVPYGASAEGLISCTVSSGACSFTDELYLTVHDSPEVDLGNDTAVCGTIILDAGNDGINYEWSTGETTQQIEVQGAQQQISVEVENTYECIGRDTIIIGACNMEDFFSDIPNLITPNSDGKNDDWIVDKLKGFPDVVVEIYDRWGRLVYRSESGYQTPWNGTNMNGNPLPTGAYHYVFLLNYEDYKQVTGSVSVIR